VVEGTGLENRQRLTSLVGSNPTPSAIRPGSGTVRTFALSRSARLSLRSRGTASFRFVWRIRKSRVSGLGMPLNRADELTHAWARRCEEVDGRRLGTNSRPPREFPWR
jgi:hypothetical protein